MTTVSTPKRGSLMGWVLTGLTVVSLAVLVLYGLVISPADAVQGDAARLIYVHVPAAWSAYLAFGVTTLTMSRRLLGPRVMLIGHPSMV